MGCAGSKPAPTPEPAKPNALLKMKSKVNVKDVDQEACESLFASFRRGSVMLQEKRPTAAAAPPEHAQLITKEKLQKRLPHIEDALFDFIWRLFDAEDKGVVDPNDFVMAIGLLTRSGEEEQVEACFHMFDTDGQGTLSRAEFRAMIQATVNLNLSSLLASDEGREAIEERMQKEFSDENLKFWQETKRYATVEEGERLKLARELNSTYVEAGAEQQVNLPSKCVKKIGDALKAAKAADAAPLPADLFAECGTEIFKLMERDTFARYRQDGNAVDRLVDDFFNEANSSKAEEVTFEDYKKWAHFHPEVLIFFQRLREAIEKLMVGRGKSAAAPADAPAANPPA